MKMILSEKFQDLKLKSKQLKQEYASARPFPHIVLDNFFNSEVLNRVTDVFPDLSKSNGTNEFSNKAEIKLASGRGDEQQPEKIKELLRFMNSTKVIDFVQELTSIEEKLVPDPHFIGGGMHEIKRGGLLKIHADFSKHSETYLDRRVNLLIYLNKDWEAEYGGELQLWDKEMKENKKILPLFNRVVIFNTTDYTYHGHPDKLNCPGDKSRKSLALYYYSNGRPKEELRETQEEHNTIFVKRPGEKDNIFEAKRLIREITPPIAIKIARKIINTRKDSSI